VYKPHVIKLSELERRINLDLPFCKIIDEKSVDKKMFKLLWPKS